MEATSISPATGPGATGIVDADRACIKCGYNIRGLSYSGMCPECGTPVENSLRGILLQFADAEYLRTILTGHAWVLNGLLVYIILQIVSLFAGLFAGAMGGAGPTGGFTTLVAFVGLAVTVWIFLGYLKLTEPDPQFTGTERPDSARQVVRIAAIVAVVANGASAIVGVLMLQGSMAIGGFGILIAGVLGILGFVAFAVQFFAMMNYTMWLARRVPDMWMVKRATTYRWLLPVLSTVGIILIGLGPLIALILYWNLLDRMRKHLKAIIATGQPADLPGALG